MRLVSSICRLLLVVQLLRSCADSSMTWSTAQTAATHAHVFMLHTSSQLPHLTRFIPGRLLSLPYAQRFVEAVCAAVRQSRCVFCTTCSRQTACPHHTCATSPPAGQLLQHAASLSPGPDAPSHAQRICTEKAQQRDGNNTAVRRVWQGVKHSGSRNQRTGSTNVTHRGLFRSSRPASTAATVTHSQCLSSLCCR